MVFHYGVLLPGDGTDTEPGVLKLREKEDVCSPVVLIRLLIEFVISSASVLVSLNGLAFDY